MANNIIKRIWNQNKMVQIEDLKGMAFQAEDGGHTFEIYGIDEAGETVTLTGTPSGVFLRPDNTDVVLDCSVSDGVVSATLPDECYDVPGRGGLTVFITADGKKTALYAAVVTVSRTSSGTVAPPATQTVVDLVNAISAAVATIPASYSALMADIAPTYSDSALYAVGQYAWYDGDLKKCIVPITTAESYTAAHWTSAVLGNDVSDLKSALKTNSLTSFYGSEKVIGNGIISLDDVGYWKTTADNGATEFIYRSYYRSAKVPCSAGDVFVINTYGAGGNYRAWAFIDSNNNIVTRCDNAYANDEIVTAPNTAVYLLINNNLNNRATGYYAFKNSTTIKSTIDQIKNDANSMIYYQALTTTDDLDTLTRSGLYAWGSSNVPQNCPVNAGCKLLCMYVNNVNITQIIVPNGDYFVRWRYKMSTGWNEWETIPDRTYIDNEIFRIDRLISDSFADKYNPVSITGESGYYWNRETDTAVKTAISSYTAYAPVSVQAGEKYSAYIYSASSSKQRPVLLVDDNYLIKQSYLGTKNAYNTFSIIIPNGVTKILLCTDSSHASATKLNKVTVQSECDAGLFDFKNANIAIIGDSISTNGDYSASNLLGNVPEIVIKDEDVGVELSAYATYYDIGTTVGGHEIVSSDVGTEITFTPTVGDVGKLVGKPKNNNAASVVTWWEVAQAVLGFNPIPVCWSGASITSHEGTDNEYKTSYAWHPAQIRKCGIRTPGTMTRTAPDMIIIYRGTNDFSHTPYSKLTPDYFTSYPWTYPDTDAVDGGYGYKEGLCLTIRKLREAYPKAKIVLCTCNFFKRVNYSSYPINNGLYTENQLNNAIREVANYMGCGLIEFDKDGLTYENASSIYYQDSSAYTHPTTAGHKILGNKALRDLLSENNML